MVLSALLAAYSQVLLKRSAGEKYGHWIREYLNIKVFIGYALLASTIFLNIYAYRGVDYKLGPILACLSYVFVLIFSTIIFKEKITRNKLIGTALILSGIVVFSL